MARIRNKKINHLIKKEIANIISFSIYDPRLKNITITRVELSDDMRIASIYYTVPEEVHNANFKKGLERAKNFVRCKLAENSQMRRVPRIDFLHDDLLISTHKLVKLIDDVIV